MDSLQFRPQPAGLLADAIIEHGQNPFALLFLQCQLTQPVGQDSLSRLRFRLKLGNFIVVWHLCSDQSGTELTDRMHEGHCHFF
jgi:hypothetical protein